MKSKSVGLIIIILAILIGSFLGYFRYELDKQIKSGVTMTDGGVCIHEEGQLCPYQELNRLFLPTLVSGIVLALFFGLGAYLIFFEKSAEILKQSQERIAETLKEAKEKEIGEEKFELVLSALDEDEKRIMRAVKEQDGISQSTLVLRTDMSKAKLSIILGELEKKGLIKRVNKGKINFVYLKKPV